MQCLEFLIEKCRFIKTSLRRSEFKVPSKICNNDLTLPYWPKNLLRPFVSEDLLELLECV